LAVGLLQSFQDTGDGTHRVERFFNRYLRALNLQARLARTVCGNFVYDYLRAHNKNVRDPERSSNSELCLAGVLYLAVVSRLFFWQLSGDDLGDAGAVHLVHA
jgi:hypothetical protein